MYIVTWPGKRVLRKEAAFFTFRYADRFAKRLASKNIITEVRHIKLNGDSVLLKSYV